MIPAFGPPVNPSNIHVRSLSVRRVQATNCLASRFREQSKRHQIAQQTPMPRRFVPTKSRLYLPDIHLDYWHLVGSDPISAAVAKGLPNDVVTPSKRKHHRYLAGCTKSLAATDRGDAANRRKHRSHGRARDIRFLNFERVGRTGIIDYRIRLHRASTPEVAGSGRRQLGGVGARLNLFQLSAGRISEYWVRLDEHSRSPLASDAQDAASAPRGSSQWGKCIVDITTNLQKRVPGLSIPYA